MINYKEVLISSIVMLILDFFYLSNSGPSFNKIVKKIQGEEIKFKLNGAIVCYIALVFSLNYFVINKKKNIQDAFILGVCIYTVYESTNHAIFKEWNGLPIYIDSVWGGILFSLTTYLTYEITKKI